MKVKIYNYTADTNQGQVSGNVLAKSKTLAEKRVKELHGQATTDPLGNVQEPGLEKIKLTQVGFEEYAVPQQETT